MRFVWDSSDFVVHLYMLRVCILSRIEKPELAGILAHPFISPDGLPSSLPHVVARISSLPLYRLNSACEPSCVIHQAHLPHPNPIGQQIVWYQSKDDSQDHSPHRLLKSISKTTLKITRASRSTRVFYPRVN